MPQNGIFYESSLYLLGEKKSIPQRVSFFLIITDFIHG